MRHVEQRAGTQGGGRRGAVASGLRFKSSAASTSGTRTSMARSLSTAGRLGPTMSWCKCAIGMQANIASIQAKQCRNGGRADTDQKGFLLPQVCNICTNSAPSLQSLHMQTLHMQTLCILHTEGKLVCNKYADAHYVQTLLYAPGVPGLPGECMYQVCRCTLYSYKLCRQFAHLFL
jgi:hypothetical protein